MKIDYKTFDNEPMEPKELWNKIISLLQESPKSKRMLIKEAHTVQSRLDQQLNRMRKRGMVTRKYYEGIWYYGLKHIYRGTNK